MSPPGKAVFLSYASQDAEAARRICDALRAAGIEVWFDQSELRGGDAWDQKIRRQIRECALFIPVISAQTRERGEGYFRLEWKLAVDRSHLMARDQPFFVPVVIDAIPNASARVPDEFYAVQWTNLPAGETPPEFTARIESLLARGPAARPAASESAGGVPASRARKENVFGRRLAIAFVLLVVVGAFLVLRSGHDAAVPVPLSEARQLAVKADALFDQRDPATRADLAVAEQLCEQALALDRNDAAVWAVYARLCASEMTLGYDLSQERDAKALDAAGRAVRLAAGDFESRLAQAVCFAARDATRAEGVRLLTELAQARPDDQRVWRKLGEAQRADGHPEQALVSLDRALQLPGGDPLALLLRSSALRSLGRYGEAEAALDEVLKIHPSGLAYLRKMELLVRFHGDLDGARAMLARVPAAWLQEQNGAVMAFVLWLDLRDPDNAITALQAVPRDYFEDSMFTGPKGFLVGYALRLAGRLDAAQIEWRAALRLVEDRLGPRQADSTLLTYQAALLACLGQRTEAEKILRVAEQLAGNTTGKITLDTDLVYLELGRRDEVIAYLQDALGRESNHILSLSRVALRIEPWWDSLRGDPRFTALLHGPEGEVPPLTSK